MLRRIREERDAYAARNGFAQEKQIVEEFNNWQNSSIAQNWLKIMGFDSEVRPGRSTEHAKTDVKVKIILKSEEERIENISCKKGRGNQIDKRWVDVYVTKLRGVSLSQMKVAIKQAAGDCKVEPTRTGFRIGEIKAQRKGGTPDLAKLQFK